MFGLSNPMWGKQTNPTYDKLLRYFKCSSSLTGHLAHSEIFFGNKMNTGTIVFKTEKEDTDGY
jgi:hypothetical protein